MKGEHGQWVHGLIAAFSQTQTQTQAQAAGRGAIRMAYYRWKNSVCFVALGWAGQVCLAATPPSAPVSVVLSCAVAYTPQRSTWVREVRIDWDKKAIRRLRIDGLEPYGFSLIPNGLMTAIDNERIQIDLKAQVWTSDFRGLAAGQGRCEAVPG